MNKEALKQFNKLNEHDKKEVMNLIRFKNEYKYQQLQQENEQLKKQVEYFKDSYVALQNGSDEYEGKLLKENKELKENWNKLKEYLENNWNNTQDIWFVKIINKMKELEGDK